MSTPHSSVVVGDGDEVVATWPGVGVDQELGHVQITAEHKTHTHTETHRKASQTMSNLHYIHAITSVHKDTAELCVHAHMGALM